MTFPLRFGLPAKFTPIDLSADFETRMKRLHNQLASAAPNVSEAERLHLLLANQYAVERMLTEGVIYAATFLGRSDRNPTTATTAQFTVMVHDSAARGGRPLETITDALRSERPRAHTQLVDLPIGRCLAVMEDNRFQTLTDLLGRHTGVTHHVRQLQLIFPLVDRGQLAFFTISTECLRDWDEYVRIMAEICTSIRWADTGGSSISNVLDG